MPTNSKVHKVYEALKREGMTTEKAVKIAQAKTGSQSDSLMLKIPTLFACNGFKMNP